MKRPGEKEIENALFEEAKRQNLDFTKTSKFAFGWRMCAKWMQSNSQSSDKERQWIKCSHRLPTGSPYLNPQSRTTRKR